MYVDDIVITESDSKGISSLKSFLHGQFHTKDSVSVVSRYMSVPIVDYWVVVEHNLCYLKRGLGQGILYSNYMHNRI